MGRFSHIFDREEVTSIEGQRYDMSCEISGDDLLDMLLSAHRRAMELARSVAVIDKVDGTEVIKFQKNGKGHHLRKVQSRLSVQEFTDLRRRMEMQKFFHDRPGMGESLDPEDVKDEIDLFHVFRVTND